MQEVCDIDIIAHRAGNSLDTLFNALEEGADIIEVDVHLTRDNIPVAQYLPYILSIHSEKKYFSEYDFSFFKDYDVVPIDKLLILAKEKSFRLLLDIKKGKIFYPNIGMRLAKMIAALDLQNYVELISFDHKCLVEAKSNYPIVRIGLLYIARLFCLEAVIKSTQPDFIEICEDYLDTESVELAKSMAVDVYGWGTDDTDTLLWYRKLGMKAVTVNNISVARELFEKNE